MPTYEVTCISRDGPDPDYRIDAVGFAGDVFPIDNVITWMQQSSDNKLYVVGTANKSVWVVVRQHPVSKRYFLETYPDGIPLNNLAHLPECP